MRFVTISMVLMLLATSLVSAYVDDVTILSPRHTFVTGLEFDRIRARDTVLIENPLDVAYKVQMFNSNLDLGFWNDPDFHPQILNDFSNFRTCGRYPTRLCIDLNQYGGFIVADNDLPDQLIGYGVYDRLRVVRGKLYPSGDARENIVFQNMGLIGIPYQAAQSTKTSSSQVQLQQVVISYPWSRGYTSKFAHLVN